MEKFEPAIFLVTNEERISEVVLSEIKKTPEYKLIRARDLGELGRLVQFYLICGVILDIRILLGASGKEKEILTVLETMCPVLKVRYNTGTQEISGMSKFTTHKGPESVGFFLLGETSIKNGKRMRAFPRYLTYLSVAVHWPEAKSPLYLNTYNVSVQGMFLCSYQAPPMGTEVEIVVEGIDNLNNLTGKVVWVRPWGESPRHPFGFGILFTKKLETIDLFLTGQFSSRY